MSSFKRNIKKVYTELGEATVGTINESNAIKQYDCPLCTEHIDIGEPHYLVVPVVKAKLRRHIHIDCLEVFLDGGFTIKLHPNEPNIAEYYF